MRLSSRYAVLVVVMTLLVPTMSSAQLRGLGRITGMVNDDGGSPIKGVSIRATREGTTGVIEETTNEKGVWAVNGMARGEWHVTFQLGGYVPLGAKVNLETELSKVPPISIVLRKLSR